MALVDAVDMRRLRIHSGTVSWRRLPASSWTGRDGSLTSSVMTPGRPKPGGCTTSSGASLHSQLGGLSLSRVRIYVAEVDKNGRVQQETEKEKVASLADTLFGGPNEKAEAIRALGVNLTIAGDAYIIGKSVSQSDQDEWFVLSCSELKRYARTGRVSTPTSWVSPRPWTPTRT